MDVVRQQVTADELLLMPDDGFRYELDDLGAAYAAETGFRLSSDPDTVRAPDVAFVSRANVEAVGEVEGFWPGAPDLAVEVVSPTDSYADVEENIFDWLDAGTEMVVVINPRQRSATVHKSPTDITALALAMRDIGKNAGKVGNLNITSEVLADLLQTGTYGAN